MTKIHLLGVSPYDDQGVFRMTNALATLRPESITLPFEEGVTGIYQVDSSREFAQLTGVKIHYIGDPREEELREKWRELGLKRERTSKQDYSIDLNVTSLAMGSVPPNIRDELRLVEEIRKIKVERIKKVVAESQGRVVHVCKPLELRLVTGNASTIRSKLRDNNPTLSLLNQYDFGGQYVN